MKEVLAQFGFNWQLALANLFNFLIIAYLLNVVIFKPLRKTLSARAEKIKEGIAASEEAQVEKVKSLEASKEIIADAKKEAMHIVTAASQEGKEITSRSMSEAEHIKTQTLEDTKVAIEKEKEKAYKTLYNETVDLVIAATKKIIDEDIEKGKADSVVKSLAKN